VRVIGKGGGKLVEIAVFLRRAIAVGDDSHAIAVAEHRELLRWLRLCDETQARRIPQRYLRTLHHAQHAERTAALSDDVRARDAQLLTERLVG